ncbi:MAG: hypothetical protein ABSA93_34395 [Streptosporangiaceae bacterium]
MSEYQYYEFLALDRPLTSKQREELRQLSTRAEITATRFTNEYHWGSFRGDPQQMMAAYFDAFLYLANWGTRHLMFRVLRTALDTEYAGQYCYTDAASLIETDDHLIISLYATATRTIPGTRRPGSSEAWPRLGRRSSAAITACCTWRG